MATQQQISNHKIIFFVVFICAAIMTSVFVFQSRHRATQSIIPEEQGLIFTAARDIKDFNLGRTTGTPFSKKDFYGHWTLLFFGFSHCSSICPTTLDLLKRTYAMLHPQFPNLQVVFISLDPMRDKPSVLNAYLQTFNSNFIGVSGKINEIRKLQSQLGVFAELSTPQQNNYQFTHSAAILLINPRAQWSGLFKATLQPQQLASAFIKSTEK
jgi:protein SCO1